MDLIDLRYLSMAVETGSFSHAAQSLGINVATVSRRITKLEDELGVKLFDRRARKVSLSIKALEVAEEKEAIAQYGSADSGASLGDILGAALKARDRADKPK